MDAIRVPRPPRLVPIRRETPFSVNPDNRMAAGTLLITWLARTETITSCPVIILESRELTAGIPDEDEESDKSQDERVIHLTEDLRVCQTANRQNADKQDWKRQKTGYGAKAQEKHSQTAEKAAFRKGLIGGCISTGCI
mgnify:CR=1 FL=1